jgi:hypothetical protein
MIQMISDEEVPYIPIIVHAFFYASCEEQGEKARLLFNHLWGRNIVAGTGTAENLSRAVNLYRKNSVTS